MLSKCANPACSAHFRYLRQGRIFNIDRGTSSSEKNASPIHRIERFWLCERCAQTLSVVLENGVVTTRSLHLERAEGAPQEESPKKRDVA